MKKSSKVNIAQTEVQQVQSDLQEHETNLTKLSEEIQEGKKTHEEAEKQKRVIEELQRIRRGCRAVLPTLRTLYLKSIERNIQKVYNDFNPASPFTIAIDNEYTPTINVEGYVRSYRDLSGEERTEIALAYRIGLGNAIYEARTGTPMELLILNEPTENLGNEDEDRTIERLTTMLSNLKIRQIIVVTHDQTFAQFADKTIQIKKTGNQSSIV
ncbi:MAG: repair protein SbcC/Rad50 [Thermoproteota archaeon]|nr:repair protein SbcC/Rad50 [Thermoproteota archaeon]